MMIWMQMQRGEKGATLKPIHGSWDPFLQILNILILRQMDTAQNQLFFSDALCYSLHGTLPQELCNLFQYWCSCKGRLEKTGIHAFYGKEGER